MRTMLAGLILAGVPLWAHHASAAEFEVDKLIVLQGRVSKVEWINPHAWLHLEVKGADGKIVVWRIEGKSPSALASVNFPKDAVKAGMEISMTAYPARNGDSVADGGTITFGDGKRLFFGGSAPVDGLDEQGRPCKFPKAGCQIPK